MPYERLSREVTLAGHSVPTFFYGTAWKEAETARLVDQALSLGFRAIDTANQRKHYFEAAVGAAVENAIHRGTVRRDELFLQTKFTHRDGQDHRLPYDPHADPRTQVEQSFKSSLEHLRTDFVDSYVLHGPSARRGLSAHDRAVWQAMADLMRAGKTRLLGASNVSLDQIEELCASGTAPAFVQNRCYASDGWDRDVRWFCTRHGIRYQGFSLLTANRNVLLDPRLASIAQRHEATQAQVVFRFALDVGMLPLTGTSSPQHGKQDLAVYDFEPLSDSEIEMMESIGLSGR
jgi:diketogulonate reductase-like aldo/keto reductase